MPNRKCLLFFGFFQALTLALAAPPNPCPNAQPVPDQLKIPAVMEPGEPIAFEKQVLAYFSSLEYRNLGWCEDVGLRDTGPFINNQSYGTHPSVRVFYSPEVRDWLLGGRKGAIKDGAVIIKEQFKPPAAAHLAMGEDNPKGCSNDWTFMIKNAKASRDGWLWGEVWNPGMNFNNPFQYPNAGYGIYCVRCHASADGEFTFSSLSNIRGSAGEGNAWPLTFRVDESWRIAGWEKSYTVPAVCGDTTPPEAQALHGHNALPAAHRPGFVRSTKLKGPDGIQTFPPEPWDKKVAGPTDPPRYLTSDQCTSCHSASAPNAVNGANMFYSTDINASQYGEWRWSPMGLAGRDPVFYAQLQSEFSYAPSRTGDITNICLNCHGAMGFKSYYWDNGINPNKIPPDSKFQYNAEWPFTKNPTSPQFAYGGLSRDGISCAVCHRIAPPPNYDLSWFLNNYINGQYDETKPGSVAGPYKDITQFPMGQALNLKPEESQFLRSSRLCGVCHTINLPVLDSPNPKLMSVEQATYLEWLNSSFQDELNPSSKAKSCQACHMATSYENHAQGISIPVLSGRLANIQDVTLPASDHLAAPKDITVRYRNEIRRHEFLGLNGLLLLMFEQFQDDNGNNTVLGVRGFDYMSGLATDLPNAIANVVEQAQHNTATVTVAPLKLQPGRLLADIEVANLTGHRFPSGVGFRRTFLEVTVLQDGKPIFTSGATNTKGEIVDGAGKVLPTEYFQNNQYQHHYDLRTPIESSNQVQIFEELTLNAKGQFTTSFLQRDKLVKDNRLLPVGWKHDGPPGIKIPKYFLEATHPEGNAATDPAYINGSGTSIVRYSIAVPAGIDVTHFKVTARLWYQSTPPYFLADRAQTKSAASNRLKYLVDGLELDKTPFASWKLGIGQSR